MLYLGSMGSHNDLPRSLYSWPIQIKDGWNGFVDSQLTSLYWCFESSIKIILWRWWDCVGSSEFNYRSIVCLALDGVRVMSTAFHFEVFIIRWTFYSVYTVLANNYWKWSYYRNILIFSIQIKFYFDILKRNCLC